MVSNEVAALIRKIKLVVFDFDGVMTDNAVYVSQEGVELVRCWRSDGLGLQALAAIGIDLLVISTEQNPVVSMRCAKLKLPCIQAVADKGERLAQILVERKLDWRQVAYIGNDINDSACLLRVGLPVVVGDAHPDVLPLAKWQTSARGGYGAVREFCDRFIAIRTKSH